MSWMFYATYNLEELNLNGWDTSKVTNMDSMFADNRKLKKIIGLTDFDTSKVTNMRQIFSQDYLLT